MSPLETTSGVICLATHRKQIKERTFLEESTLNMETILRISLEERLAIGETLPLERSCDPANSSHRSFCWWAIFESLSPSDPRNAQISGYAFPIGCVLPFDVFGSCFFQHARFGDKHCQASSRRGYQKVLIQPVGLKSIFSCHAWPISWHTFGCTLPFAFVFFLCRGYFVTGWPDASHLFVCIASILLSFVLGFFLEACMGLAAFWFLEISSLLFVYMLFSFFLSGHMFLWISFRTMAIDHAVLASEVLGLLSCSSVPWKSEWGGALV